MRSASSASQATVFKKKSWLPSKDRSWLLAKSASPKAATRPSFGGGAASSDGLAEDEGEAAGESEVATAGDAAGDGEGEAAVTGTVATAPSEIGPRVSLPESIWMGSFSVRSVSAQEAAAVSTRFCAVTPDGPSVAAFTLRAVWNAVISRKSLVISWYGY